MTVVRCEKDDCIYNEDGACTSDIVWITETGECEQADECDEEEVIEFLEDDDEDDADK